MHIVSTLLRVMPYMSFAIHQLVHIQSACLDSLKAVEQLWFDWDVAVCILHLHAPPPSACSAVPSTHQQLIAPLLQWFGAAQRQRGHPWVATHLNSSSLRRKPQGTEVMATSGCQGEGRQAALILEIELGFCLYQSFNRVELPGATCPASPHIELRGDECHATGCPDSGCTPVEW